MMVDRWSLGYSCAVLLVGILQVIIMMIFFDDDDGNDDVDVDVDVDVDNGLLLCCSSCWSLSSACHDDVYDDNDGNDDEDHHEQCSLSMA